MDDEKLLFSSNWGIEQVLAHGTVTVTAVDVTDALIVSYASLGITKAPRVIISWKRHSSTRWQMNGASDPGFTNISAKLKSDGLYVQTYDSTPISVDVRYTVYVDSVEG